MNFSPNKNKGGRLKNPSIEKNISTNKIPVKLKANQSNANNIIRFSSVKNSNSNCNNKEKNIFNTSNNSNDSGDETPPIINVNDFLIELSKKTITSKVDISCFTNEDLTKQTANTTAITSNKLTNVQTEISASKESEHTFLPLNSNNEIQASEDKSNEDEFNADLTDEGNEVDEFCAETDIRQEDNTRDLSKENIEEMKGKFKAKYNRLYREFKSYSNILDCDTIFSMYKEIEDNKTTAEEVIKKIEEYIKKQLPYKKKEFIELFYSLIYYEQQYKNIEEKTLDGK